MNRLIVFFINMVVIFIGVLSLVLLKNNDDFGYPFLFSILHVLSLYDIKNALIPKTKFGFNRNPIKQYFQDKDNLAEYKYFLTVFMYVMSVLAFVSFFKCILYTYLL